jgi:BirA family biotin operon repressor/biotin-[acetyl-CoA-carboxylase] ligase
VDDDFALVVRWPDGTRETVTGGDVSVRGLFGYLD